MRNEENSDAFADVKHKYDDPFASLFYVHVHKYIIYVVMGLAKSTHQQVIPSSARFRTSRKNERFFYCNYPGRYVCARKKTLLIEVSTQEFLLL